MDNEDF